MRTPFTQPSFAPHGRPRVRHASAELARATVAGGDDIPVGARGLLADQMHRAAASIHADAADEYESRTRRDRLHCCFAWAPHGEPVAGEARAEPAASALREHHRQFGRMLHALCCALCG